MKNVDLDKYAVDVGDLVTDQRVIPMDNVDALLAEHLALNSSQPVAYSHLDDITEMQKIGRTYVYKGECKGGFALYTANPINQELLDAVKSLQTALLEVTTLKSRTLNYGVARQIANLALASLSPNVIKLIGE